MANTEHNTVPDALATLVSAWKADPDFRYSWLANIAVHFQDCAPKEWLSGETHRVSNEAAERFLKSLESGHVAQTTRASAEQLMLRIMEHRPEAVLKLSWMPANETTGTKESLSLEYRDEGCWKHVPLKPGFAGANPDATITPEEVLRDALQVLDAAVTQEHDPDDPNAKLRREHEAQLAANA